MKQALVFEIILSKFFPRFSPHRGPENAIHGGRVIVEAAMRGALRFRFQLQQSIAREWLFNCIERYVMAKRRARRGSDAANTVDNIRLTAIADIPDLRDCPYEPALLQLKQHISLTADLDILDQGQEGACGSDFKDVAHRFLVSIDCVET